ncbi:MAG: PUTATIVE ZINC PROTEASE PROTEIN [Rhodanobacteraceae bacterium]|nr:MAG: PUTATIVE ZINC PROTEASE PROTEIN [Rhodanobacteraceae bacterium]
MNARRPRHKTILRTLTAAGVCAALTGCSTLGYYAHLAAGEMAVLRARVPIKQVIADPDTDPALKARLALALRARAFASDTLKLPRNRSYTTYADIHRPFVMWNVFATPALSLQPVEHCFLFAGCVAYQGFYHHDRAEALAAKLKQQGDDVWIGGVPAYSTLGHFADPLLSTMDRWSDDEMIGTIFHELAHQRFYVKNDTAFNESFATFLQREGLREWHADNHLPPPDAAGTQRRKQFTELVLATRKKLEALYASDLSDAVKLARKQQTFADMRHDYERMRDTEWHGNAEYDHWFDTPPNNAKLLPFGLYDRGVPAFAALFRQYGGDWTRFYAAVRKIGNEPAKQRDAFLTDTSTQKPTAVDALKGP